MITIIVAIISSCIPAILSLVGINLSNNKHIAQSDQNLADYKDYVAVKFESTCQKIDNLQKHVDKHNQVIERVYELEKKDSIQDEKINNLKLSIEHERKCSK